MNLLFVFALLIGYGGHTMATNEEILKSYQGTINKLDKLLKEVRTQQQPQSSNKASKIFAKTEVLKSILKEIKDRDLGKKNQAQSESEEEKKEKDDFKQQMDLVKGVGNGLISVIKGITKKSWLDVVSGGLDVLASVSLFAGLKGLFVAPVLSLISICLRAFGSKKVKSQTELILDGVTDALEKFKDDKLAATTLYYLRDIQQADVKIDAVFNSDDISRDELINLFNDMEKLFLIQDKGGITLVNLELIIKESCAVEASCNQCLQKVQEYLMLSMQRQLFALRVLGLHPNLEEKERETDQINLKEKRREIEQINLEILFERFTQMRRMERKWLDYFLKPMASNIAKTCVAKYYHCPGEYPIIDAYMKMLLENQNVIEPGLHFIASKKENLNGHLDIIYTKSYEHVSPEKSAEIYPWLKELKSVFIPPKYEVLMVTKQQRVIRFKGPTAVNLDNDFISFEMFENQNLNGEYIRACFDQQMGGQCIQIDPKDYSSPHPVLFQEDFEPKSLYIPPGLQVSIFVPGSTQYSYATRGPITLGDICISNTKISKILFTDAEFPNDAIKICSKGNFEGWCDYIDVQVLKTNMIHGCEWKNIGSYIIPESMILETKVKVFWGFKQAVEDRYGPETSVIDTELNNVLDISVRKSP